MLDDKRIDKYLVIYIFWSMFKTMFGIDIWFWKKTNKYEEKMFNFSKFQIVVHDYFQSRCKIAYILVENAFTGFVIFKFK